MNKKDFVVGENVDLTIYSYDDQSKEYTRNVSGKVYQITDNFVVIDKGITKESFQYSELERNIVNMKQDCTEPYDLSIENYNEDIINDCINDFENDRNGFVFNLEQLKEVISRINTKNYETKKSNNLYFIKKI